MNLSLKGGSVLLALFAISASADQWTFFHPELVKSMTCKVELSSVQHGREGVAGDRWLATASAKRTQEEGDWVMTIGEFPATLKGRHEAEKACSKWMDEAAKRVREAQK